MQEPLRSQRFGPVRRPDRSRESVRDDRPRPAVPEVAGHFLGVLDHRRGQRLGERRSGLTVLAAIPRHETGANEDRAAGLYATPASLRAAPGWSTVIETEP